MPEWNDEPAGYQVSSDGLDLLDVDVVDATTKTMACWSSISSAHRPSRIDATQEAIEDARVDDILARLHDSSWDALSPDEIAILQRASQRYRRRRHRPTESATAIALSEFARSQPASQLRYIGVVIHRHNRSDSQSLNSQPICRADSSSAAARVFGTHRRARGDVCFRVRIPGPVSASSDRAPGRHYALRVESIRPWRRRSTSN